MMTLVSLVTEQSFMNKIIILYHSITIRHNTGGRIVLLFHAIFLIFTE